MRTQFKILFFIICLNLATGVAIALNLPGTEYITSSDPGGGQQNATAYEEHYNATQIAERWAAKQISIPIIGDIFAGLSFLVINFRYLIDGFPILLTWLSDIFVTDASGRLAFAVIAGALRALYAILMSIFIMELISGRQITE